MKEFLLSLVGCAVVAGTLIGVSQAQSITRPSIGRPDGLHIVLDDTAKLSFEHAVRGQTEGADTLVDPITGTARLSQAAHGRSKQSLYDGPTVPQMTDIDPTAAVPEPSTWILMLGGLLLVVHLARRRGVA